MTASESPEEQSSLDPASFAALAAARARDLALTEREKVEIAGAEAEVRLKRAQAQEAQHRAAMEPARQRMTLKERETRRQLRVLLAVFAAAFLVGVLVLAPWVLPPTGIAAALAYVWRGAGG